MKINKVKRPVEFRPGHEEIFFENHVWSTSKRLKGILKAPALSARFPKGAGQWMIYLFK